MSEMVRVGTAPEPGRYGCFEALSSWLARVCGLLGPPERGRAVLIERCRSIHTFGMRFATTRPTTTMTGIITASSTVICPRVALPPALMVPPP